MKTNDKIKAILIVISFSITFTAGSLIYRKLTNEKLKVNAAEHYNKPNKIEENSVSLNLRNGKEVNNKSLLKNDGNKIAYLTFDDGPSKLITPKVLDVLKKENIKATFFVIGMYAEKNKDLVIRENKEGHLIGNHSYSHDTRKKSKEYIYLDTKVFINELNRNNELLKGILGNSYNLKLIRFPGGSFGHALEPFRIQTEDNGYCYVDWNCLTGDAEGKNAAVDKLIERFNGTSKENGVNKNHLIILMHDGIGKETTAEALPKIINILKNRGYIFKTIE